VNDKKFTPFPILHTPRLTLRKLTTGDSPTIFKLRNDESVCRFLIRERQTEEKEALGFIERINSNISAGTSVYWAVCLNTNSEMIGTLCLWNFSDDEKIAELGYELLPAHQGRGFMMEAVGAVVDYGFETCSLSAIEAYTHKDNLPSKQLIRKFGFQLVSGKLDADNPSTEVYILQRPME
jgi:ribosomal-protein-alanine N-acetyltransferase